MNGLINYLVSNMATPYVKKSIPSYKSESFLVEIVRENDQPRLIVKADKYLRHWLKEHAKPGDVGTMKIELKKPKRTSLQNSFYWVYLDLVSLSSGHTPKELHNWAKGKFMTKGISEVFGDKVRQVKSTTDLNRSEFVEYLSRIEETTGVPIPDPEPFSIGITHKEYEQLKKEQRKNYKKIKAKI
jgi:hypothetical protein